MTECIANITAKTDRSITVVFHVDDGHTPSHKRRRHRTDGPAVEYADGTKSWYIHGRIHRTDGPAIEYADGTNSWYYNGNRHREDGPAVERSDGLKAWYIDGKLHRTDGPAIERADGSEVWYLNGVEVTEADVMSPAKEMTMAELEAALGHNLKVVK